MIGVIVDGPGDLASIRRRWKGYVRVVKADGPRGDSVQSDDIARAAVKQIQLLHGLGCQTVVVMTDRENRRITAADFGKEIRRCFVGRQLPCKVLVAVPDRMIENWYLADLEELSRRRNYVRSGLKQAAFEGTDGKRELKKRLEAGCSYSEIKHGPQLFSTVRLHIGMRNSDSLRRFVVGLRNSGVPA